MQKTKIDYLTHTWNPVAMKCTRVSEGCKNCWHLKLCNLRKDNTKISAARRNAYRGHGFSLLLNELIAPLRRKIPSVIGVQFMGDLFHEEVPNKWLDYVFCIICLCPQHRFVLFTKRLPQANRYFNRFDDFSSFGHCIFGHYMNDAFRSLKNLNKPISGYLKRNVTTGIDIKNSNELDNLWLGTSCENDSEFIKRMQYLYMLPVSNKVLSLEPLLESIDFTNDQSVCIDWCILGCESGPQRRRVALEDIYSTLLSLRKNNNHADIYIKQIEIDGKVSHDPKEWPEDLNIREMPIKIERER